MVLISLMLATFAAERRWTWIGCTIEQRGHIDEASSPGLSARSVVAGVHRVVVFRLYLTILLQNYLKRCARLNVTYLRTLSVNNHQHVETSVVLFGIEARENCVGSVTPKVSRLLNRGRWSTTRGYVSGLRIEPACRRRQAGLGSRFVLRLGLV